MYRCKALADVLPKYAKRVETAFDFLTKDMGEDRWLCTLLVSLSLVLLLMLFRDVGDVAFVGDGAVVDVMLVILVMLILLVL